MTTGDLSNLAEEINRYTGTTGVSAAVTGTGEITLTEGTGKDIGIENFASSGDNGETIVFRGSAEAAGVTLTGPTGGTPAATDSAVAVGEVSLKASVAFSVESSVANSAGSVFGLAANTSASGSLSAVSNIDISTAAGGVSALDVLDGALQAVSGIRADLGAIQSRFESTISNLSVTVENAEAARSRILDADFAAETAKLTRAQILQQAGVAILAQANVLPQNALALLQ